MHRIVIATPHYYHTTIAIAAIGAGLNVLTEKPLSVHKADCEKVIAAFEARPDKSKIFSEMFNQREYWRSRYRSTLCAALMCCIRQALTRPTSRCAA